MEYRTRGYPGIVVEKWGGSPKVYCCRECAWVYVSAGIFHPQDELLSLCTWAMKVPNGSLIGNGLLKSREQSHPECWHHHHLSSWTLAHRTFTQPLPTHSAAATPRKAAGLICSHHQTLSTRCPTEEGRVLSSYSSSLWWPQHDRARLTSQRPFFVKGKLSSQDGHPSRFSVVEKIQEIHPGITEWAPELSKSLSASLNGESHHRKLYSSPLRTRQHPSF